MLPKPEKPLKSKSIRQLEDSDSRQPKSPKNQTFVVITLGFTIFLSLFFLIYHKVKLVINGGPIVLPSLNFRLPSIIVGNQADHLKQQLRKIDPKKADTWSIFTGVYQNQPHPSLWSQNFSSDPQTIIDTLTSASPSGQTLVTTTLPQGLEIIEILPTTDNPNLAYKINLPQKYIIIIIDPSSLSSLELVPKIISALYWELISTQ